MCSVKISIILVVAALLSLGKTEINENSTESTPLTATTDPPPPLTPPSSTTDNATSSTPPSNTTAHAPSSTSATPPSEPQQDPGSPKQPLLNLPPRLQALLATIRQSENEYGHVEVREGAFLFWWLYFADGSKEDAHTKPLVIWVQGGPSIPGSGLGNFVEIGPLTTTLRKRSHSWVNGKNVLFVDSPVGTGYSYTAGDDRYCKTDKDVAADLIQLTKALLERFPQFRTTPTHIFSQSYGTKIASYFAYYLYKDIEKGNVEANLKTVALGSSWINPKETSLATGEYLYQTGFLDKPEYMRVRNLLSNMTAMIDRKEYKEAFKYRLDIIGEVYKADLSFDAYNVFHPPIGSKMMQLTALMNGLVSLSLGGSYGKRKWSFFNEDVFGALSQDFMKPAQHVVENILRETNLSVVVYNGDFDAVTPMSGAVNWVHELQWSGKEKFWSAKRHNLKGQSNGFFKEHGKLSLWWILKAGHWVPTDNPEGMDQILQYIVHENKETSTASAAKNRTKDESVQQ